MYGGGGGRDGGGEVEGGTDVALVITCMFVYTCMCVCVCVCVCVYNILKKVGGVIHDGTVRVCPSGGRYYNMMNQFWK
jgi:hypothetical protein